MKIFLDTAPIIYLIDADARYIDKMKDFIQDALDSSSKLVTSVITGEEYLVHPYKTKNAGKILDFYSFISECDVEMIDVNLEIADNAAAIRAEYPNFKSMDALQLAAAEKSNCDIFLTNDKQLRQFKSVDVKLVEDL